MRPSRLVNVAYNLGKFGRLTSAHLAQPTLVTRRQHHAGSRRSIPMSVIFPKSILRFSRP